ncbi:hypothetical protein EDC04DRAFT_2946495 [Pisolithus marmoratus]|nr:hypothetical protein EDC04DRAFT_2946495 [Pisolithus marmoratus]
MDAMERELQEYHTEPEQHSYANEIFSLCWDVSQIGKWYPDYKSGIADPVIDRRMELFLHHVQKFARGIIFNNLPCLKRNGYQWVPRSFLDKTYAADTTRMRYTLVDVGYPAYEAVLHTNLHSIRGSGTRYLGICLESAASHHPITIVAGDGDVCYRVQLLLDETSDFSGWNCTT